MPHRQTPSVEADEDGEGEEDDGNEEDKNLYCFCQKLSYGTVGIRRCRSQHTWLTISRLRWLVVTTRIADTNG